MKYKISYGRKKRANRALNFVVAFLVKRINEFE